MADLSVLKNLIIPSIFGVDDDDSSPFVNDVIEQAYKYMGGRVDYGCGASKLCLIPREGDKVVKLPFFGNVYLDENIDYDDATSEDWGMTEYCYSGCEDEPWNYCAAELQIYEKAAEAGFACFLAKTEFYGYTHSGHPMYLQEKVEEYNCGRKDKKPSQAGSRKSKEILDAYAKYIRSYQKRPVTVDEMIGYAFSQTGEEFIGFLIDAYGYEKVSEFATWIYDNAREIASDLHWGNIGFRESDNTPCLLDFCGFDY